MIRVRFHQIPMEPVGLVRKENERRQLNTAEGEEAELVEDFVDVPCVKGGQCLPMGIEHIGGGNPAAGRWMLNLLTLEPIEE